ncbi:MAG: FAD-dependent oxidoreductase [Pseudohongiellaceae bacterium]
MNKTRFLIAALILAAVAAYFMFDLGRFLTLSYAQSQLANIHAFRDSNFPLTAALYFALYVVITALSIPGALVITLIGGAIFGLLWGTLLVSFASCIGATLAFLVSRLLLRDWVQRKFGNYLAPVNRGIKKDGIFYLFSIRMVPLFPFFVINLLMGLTPIRTFTYYWVSQLGMLPATVVYVNAGSELAQIDSLAGLVNGSVLFALALLGLFPLFARLLINRLQRRRHTRHLLKLRRLTRPRRFDANVVVIGAGSAGLVASLIVAGAKAKVVLIEKNKMGGDCLNTGCVPSKSLLRSGHIMSCIRRAEEFGITNATGNVDFARVMQRVQGIIKTIEPHDSVERFTSLGVECVAGEANIESPWTVRVGDRHIHTRAIILATGARPLVPNIPGLEQVPWLSSDTIWSLTTLPRKLLVVGGGPIGCELAQAFSNLGSEVVQLDMAPRILPREDPEVSVLMTDRFTRQGIQVLTNHKLLRFGKDASVINAKAGEGSDVNQSVMDAGDGRLTVDAGDGQSAVDAGDGRPFAEAEHNGETIRVEFDYVLLALGRKANVEGFGLEQLQMPLTEQGTVEVNQYMQTAYPNIYACGDVASPWQFTHIASYQAWFAALNAILGGWWRSKASYRVVPWATFTDPEVARVGLSEEEAKTQNIPFEITRYELSHHDRALADGEAHGFVKVLTEPGKDKILGATITGHHAADLIGEFVLAMTHNMGLKQISAATHIYPTMLEANKFAANAWRSARLPEKYFPLLKRYFNWRRGA